MEPKDTFKFCPRCKGMLIHQKEMLFCGECKLKHYLNPKACITLFIENEKGEMLLTKRKNQPFKGWWEIPGGFVDSGEILEQAVIREAKEELALEVDQSQLKYFISKPGLYEFEGMIYKVVNACFIVKVESKVNLKPGDDVVKAEWVSKSKIDFSRLAFEADNEALKEYLKQNRV